MASQLSERLEDAMKSLDLAISAHMRFFETYVYADEEDRKIAEEMLSEMTKAQKALLDIAQHYKV